MNAGHPQPCTEGASQFDPDVLFDDWGNGRKLLPENHDLRSAIISIFSLSKNDSYVYHAIASVTLSQVQAAIGHGAGFGLHAWYLDNEGSPVPSPAQDDVTAYAAIFSASTSTSKVLKGFAANAKKGSIRSRIATHLLSQRLIPLELVVSRNKGHVNPYYDFWAWSCLNLEWAGPDENTEMVKTSHHILPVFMHHFGCVVPSYESLEVIRYFAGTGKEREKRAVLEVGSGNGYWTYTLRRLGVEVQAVDNQQSEYRTTWIGDTIIAEGEKYLRDNGGCREKVLLMVYPVVSADFTGKILKNYRGDTVIVAGTQNANGYTAFNDRTINDYMQVEKREFEKTVQIPLPSFAGKDEALFVFERKTI